MPIRILAAEDNEADVFLLQQTLKAAGLDFLLERAVDGEQAVRRLTEGRDDAKPALLILDLHLPRRSGREVIETIRAGDLTTPIIVLASMPGESDRAALLAIGAQLVLNKPTDLEGYRALGLTIKEFCDQAAGSAK